jgi:hypothetical protein
MNAESIQEINRAIAEACGWRPSRSRFQGFPPNKPDSTLLYDAEYYPGYWENLHACCEFESKNPFLYSTALREILENHVGKTEWDGGNKKAFYFITATAPQRCEAFLKTLGLWREEWK